MKFSQIIKRILKMENIAEKINSMLPDTTPAEIDMIVNFDAHIELTICDMAGLDICLEENGVFIPVQLLDVTPVYATFQRPDGSRLGRNLQYCADIWLA